MHRSIRFPVYLAFLKTHLLEQELLYFKQKELLYFSFIRCANPTNPHSIILSIFPYLHFTNWSPLVKIIPEDRRRFYQCPNNIIKGAVFEPKCGPIVVDQVLSMKTNQNIELLSNPVLGLGDQFYAQNMKNLMNIFPSKEKRAPSFLMNI